MHQIADRLARLFAFLGGVVLSFLILLTVASIVGRSLNSILHSGFLQGFAPGLADALLATGIGPINGDFEIVQAGMAFAIFAFIPLCQLHFGHATVDIFTSKLPIGFNRWLRAISEVAFAFVLALIAVQLFAGMQTKLRVGETTFLLQYPVWWGYALCLVAAITAALVGAYVAVMRVLEALTGEDLMEAGH